MIARRGNVEPWYNYAAVFIAVILWSAGTSIGIIAGNFLPANVVSALSVALYGMFIAIIIPPAKQNRVVMICIIVSFMLSYLCSILPYVSKISGGNKTIILTVIIASAAAIIKPIETGSEASDVSQNTENAKAVHNE